MQAIRAGNGNRRKKSVSHEHSQKLWTMIQDGKMQERVPRCGLPDKKAAWKGGRCVGREPCVRKKGIENQTEVFWLSGPAMKHNNTRWQDLRKTWASEHSAFFGSTPIHKGREFTQKLIFFTLPKPVQTNAEGICAKCFRGRQHSSSLFINFGVVCLDLAKQACLKIMTPFHCKWRQDKTCIVGYLRSLVLCTGPSSNQLNYRLVLLYWKLLGVMGKEHW